MFSYNDCKYRHPLLLISNIYLEICWTEHICMLCVCYIPFLNGTNAFLDHPKLSLKLLHLSLKLTFFPNFIYECILAALGLRRWVQAFSSCSEWRLPSSCGAQGSSCCTARALGCVSSVAVVPELSCPQLTGSSWTGIAPMPPALVGGS